MGDGQKVALRLQASYFFQTYSLSFSEPWLGGKKPIQFSTSLSHSKQFLYSGNSNNVDKSKSFNITSLSVGIAKRLTIPDDYFMFSSSVSFQYYDLHNYNTGLFTFGDGSSKNLAYTVGLSRSSKGVNPIYPTSGSEFSVSAKFTLPYSLFNNIDYGNLENQKDYKITYTENSTLLTTQMLTDNFLLLTIIYRKLQQVQAFTKRLVQITLRRLRTEQKLTKKNSIGLNIIN